MIFSALSRLNEFLWANVALVLIFSLGIYLSFRSRLFQFRCFRSIFSSFYTFIKDKNSGSGVHPIRVFFAAIGGCIGIGNVVGIATAVQLGGPGALFWTWIGAMAGMLIQYAEVYLGMRYRVKNGQNGYDGGPMFFLPHAYKIKCIAPIICLLLCIYGAEIFVFNVLTDTISVNLNLNKLIVVPALFAATVGVASRGLNRVGAVCGALIPLFILCYTAMGVWVLIQHASEIPSMLYQVIQGAFTPQAAVGGFAGCTLMTTISMGLSRGAYSGDIGVGFASVIHSESSTEKFKKQAGLAIAGIFIDTILICSLSIFIILITGHWKSGVDATLMVQQALDLYFPYMNVFMPIFLFLLGYTTLLSYFAVGTKCAKFIFPKWGPRIYFAYTSIILPIFAFVDVTQAFIIMSLCGFFLLFFNLLGIFILRREIEFGVE